MTIADDYLKQTFQTTTTKGLWADWGASKAEDFVEESVTQILELHPKMVGFTSVFQQQIASLAIAQRLKTRRREIFILFAGRSPQI